MEVRRRVARLFVRGVTSHGPDRLRCEGGSLSSETIGRVDLARYTDSQVEMPQRTVSAGTHLRVGYGFVKEQHEAFAPMRETFGKYPKDRGVRLADENISAC